VQIDAQPAPDIAWVAWLGAAVEPATAPARPYYLRAPDAKPQTDPLQKASRPQVS
jgi:tRNA threonylcarbamoyladenosine biosynthesis protein TsaB